MLRKSHRVNLPSKPDLLVTTLNTPACPESPELIMDASGTSMLTGQAADPCYNLTEAIRDTSTLPSFLHRGYFMVLRAELYLPLFPPIKFGDIFYSTSMKPI